MPLVLITPPITGPKEFAQLHTMFSRLGGLHWRLHLRKPQQSLAEHLAYLDKISPEFRDRIILHDFHELAERFDLGGIHHRERQIPVDTIIASSRKTVSVGFHNPRSLLVDRGEVDYCLLSPIYDSISKDGYCTPADLSNRESLKEFIAQSPHPVIALGGVRPSRFSELADWGFAGAAMLGAVWDAVDPVAAFEEALAVDYETDWAPMYK